MTSRKFKYQRREDSTSAEHCCVPLCEASSRFNSMLSFHTFPDNVETRRKWIQNIRREIFNITSHTRVCSRHFKSDDLIEASTPKGRRLCRKGAVPTLFEWNGYCVAKPRRTGVGRRRKVYTHVDGDPVPMDAHHMEHDYCSVPEPAAVDNALDQAEDLRKEVARLKRQVEDLSEKLEEALAEMRQCPLCQRHQKDSSTLYLHLTKKHSVHPACLGNLLNAPYVNRSDGVVSVSISQNPNGTSAEKPQAENTNSPLIAVELDWTSQETDTNDKSGEGNSRSRYGDTGASAQEFQSNTKTNAAAADGRVNHSFQCHRCQDFFTPKSAMNVHYNRATHVQKTRSETGNDGDSSTPILTYPYVSTKPYQCDVCHVSYFYSFGLESHLKSVLHQSRSRKAENAAANSKTITETRIVVSNLAGTPVVNAIQLPSAKTCNCVKQAEKVQLQPASLLHPVASAQAMPTVLPGLTLAPNSVTHTIVPSVVPPAGTSTPQLIPQPQMLMPLIVNGLRTQSAPADRSQQILQQAVPVLGLGSARQVKELGSGDSKSQSVATGVSSALETNTTVDGVKVKIEFKEEPCYQEISQMQTTCKVEATSHMGIKQENNSVWDGIEASVACGDEPNVNHASPNQDARDYFASKASCAKPCQRLSPELTEFQSQVLWAFIESRNEADSKIPPREDCEALGREVGLTEDEVQKWLMETYHTKDRHRAEVQSPYERQESTEDVRDALTIDEIGRTICNSTTDFLSDEDDLSNEQTTMDKKRKRGMD